MFSFMCTKHVKRRFPQREPPSQRPSSQSRVARMCASLDSPERATTGKRRGDGGHLAVQTLEKLDIGRGSSKGGVDSHARWFEDGKPLFLKIS